MRGTPVGLSVGILVAIRFNALYSRTTTHDDLGRTVQEPPAHEKQRPPRTLQKDYAYGPTAVIGGVAISYEQSTLELSKNDTRRHGADGTSIWW